MKNTTDLAKRRGKIALARINITKPDQPILKALFENFYPIHIENKVSSTSMDGGELWYYGISPLFRVVREGEDVPEYEARFRRFTGIDEESEDRVVLEEMKEVK